MEEKKKFWVGTVPKKCQGCANDLDKVFYDCATRGGHWALLCHTCFVVGPGLGKLGTGTGQQYEKQPDGRWLKTGG